MAEEELADDVAEATTSACDRLTSLEASMSELEMDHRKLEVDHRRLRDQIMATQFIQLVYDMISAFHEQVLFPGYCSRSRKKKWYIVEEDLEYERERYRSNYWDQPRHKEILAKYAEYNLSRDDATVLLKFSNRTNNIYASVQLDRNHKILQNFHRRLCEADSLPTELLTNNIVLAKKTLKKVLFSIMFKKTSRTVLTSSQMPIHIVMLSDVSQIDSDITENLVIVVKTKRDVPPGSVTRVRIEKKPSCLYISVNVLNNTDLTDEWCFQMIKHVDIYNNTQEHGECIRIHYTFNNMDRYVPIVI